MPVNEDFWRLEALRAFDDNYIWMLSRAGRALVVDPGDCDPVFAALEAHKLALDTILITHHHGDHIGGVAALAKATSCAVYGTGRERMPEGCRPLHGGDAVSALGVDWRVIDLPGHTLGHIGYVSVPLRIERAGDLAPTPADAPTPVLLCGDTLFSAGCGRLFEGTPGQMHTALSGLAALPPETAVLCTHEYTLSNLRFAEAVLQAGLAKTPAADVDNWAQDLLAYAALCKARRASDQITLPSSVAQERRINPFLRCDTPLVRAAVGASAGAPVEQVFAALRQWKDRFQ